MTRIRIIQKAKANPKNVIGNTTNLSVLAISSELLIYNWNVVYYPDGVLIPTFSENNSPDAKNTIATFYGPGSYKFKVTIINPVTNESIVDHIEV